MPRNRPEGKERVYILLSPEEKQRWMLCAGPEGISTWARRVVNAVTCIEHGYTVPQMDQQYAANVIRNPVWDVDLLPPEQSNALDNLRKERIRQKKERNRVTVPLCEWTKLPRFACSCKTCTTGKDVKTRKAEYKALKQTEKAP